MSPYLCTLPERYTMDGSFETEKDFPYINADPLTLPSSLNPFTITTSTGFLPLQPPRVILPDALTPAARLVEDMPILKADGSPGLLAMYQLGPTIDCGQALPNLCAEIDNIRAPDGKPDLATITAVFRDYCFLASAYLLEPCWERWDKGLEGFGLGRQMLPECIAGPLVKTAKLLDIPPFMSYAAAYALYNYRVAGPSANACEYGNLRLIRAFERGLDPSSSEAGFVLTHTAMVQDSPLLITGAVHLLEAVAVRVDHAGVVDAFGVLLQAMQAIEASMETMWSHSKPKDYNTYRTFLFGITNQSMFPNGVVYEGEHDNQPLFFRGESGANDSMIPLLDALLQISMPPNPLTEILQDFRSYRPKPHRDFLACIRQRADELSVRDHCCQDLDTTILYLRLLDHVRSFRWRHWLFAREYILHRSRHPTASGGSPIVTWLPNQLFAVIDLMTAVWKGMCEDQKNAAGKYVNEMMANMEEQRVKLRNEVDRWCQERGV